MGKKIGFLHPCHPYQSGAMPPLAPGAPPPARATLLIITFLLTDSAWSLLLLLLEAEPVPSYFTVRYFPLETLAPNNQGALQKVLVFINYF